MGGATPDPADRHREEWARPTAGMGPVRRSRASLPLVVLERRHRWLPFLLTG